MDRSSKLLAEIMTLLSNYTREEFDQAILRLDHERIQDTLITTKSLRSYAKTINKPRSERKRKTPKENIESKIFSLNKSQDPVRREIGNFIGDVVDRKILNSPSSLKEFTNTIGIPISGKKLNRIPLALNLAKHLETLPPNSAQDQMEIGRTLDAKPSSLQSWANVIVKPQE